MLQKFLKIEVFIILWLALLFIFESPELYIITYVAVFIIFVTRSFLYDKNIFVKFLMFAIYFSTLTLQLIFLEEFFLRTAELGPITYFLLRLMGIGISFVPMLVSKYAFMDRYKWFYLPNFSKMASISFSEMKASSQRVIQAVNHLEIKNKVLVFKTIMEEIPRNDSFRYINNGTLTEDYFREVEKCRDVPYIYIVISNTRSETSQFLSMFTKKKHNHVSLSFDRDLKTILSYNGGERICPPGLNQEMIEFFSNPGASIMVYGLPCDLAAKERIIEKIKQINREGSAYNMLGLLTKHSFKPNIMFCSQFVYNMLCFADLHYFEKFNGRVAPTDFIELDYYRKLKFEYEINFSA